MIGEVLGAYRIVARLGQGRTGEVFAAEHASVGTKAAIKVIAPALVADAGRLQRYLKDAQAASRIANQGTVKISEVGPNFVVMEHLQGETLAKRIARTKRLSITQIAELGRQLATIVAAMHDENLVHRDLRPAKIFVLREAGLAQERLKLLVGNAPLLGPAHAAAYAAPEIWRGEQVDWRADIYALGCTIYEMATGEPPYSGNAGPKHLEYPIPQARSVMPDVPPALDALIARLMAKHVDQRPKSLREVARELDSLGGTSRPLAATQNSGVIAGGELNALTLPPGPGPIATTVPDAAPRGRVPVIVVVGIALAIAGAVAIAFALAG